MTKSKMGILLQGRVSEWLPSIIQEYKMNFPDTMILLSTWNNENIEGIDCEVVKTEPPKPTHPHNPVAITWLNVGLGEPFGNKVLKSM